MPVSVAITPETRLLAEPRATLAQAQRHLLSRPHGEYTEHDVRFIAERYFETSQSVGLDPLLVIAQMVLETGNLTSHWSQRPRRNPAGIGVTGEPGAGVSFPSWAVATRAHTGRLLAYAISPGQESEAQRTLIQEALTWRPLPNHLRGVAPTLKGLVGRWATDPQYATKISQVANAIAATER